MPKPTFKSTALEYCTLKKLFSCFFFLTLIVTYCNCSKTKPTTVAINNALKANYNFQPGSYWIYKDTVSGETDSFVVMSNEFQNYPAELNADLNYDYINININEYKGPMHADTTLWGLVLHGNYISFGTSYVDNYCTYPFVVGEIKQDYNSNGSFTSYALNLYTPYTINNLSFDSVLEVRCVSDTINDTFFVTNNALMARMVINDNVGDRVYELLRYHIIR